MKKMSNKGFSMIELVGTVTILGVLSVISIVSVQALITKARVNYYKSLEENMIMAGRSYLETNKQYMPKISGQTSKITLKTLKNAKYLNDDVIDYQKNECDKELSYVQVFKYQDEYLYSTYLVCPGDNKQPPSTFIEFEQFNVEFSGDVKTAKAKLQLQEKYGIVSYSYKIYKNEKLVYTSEVFNEHNNTSLITKAISLTNYTPGTIEITLTAINKYGISKTKTFSSTKCNKQCNYIDKDLPECVILNSEDDPRVVRPWATSREITIGCNDSAGVGCTREKYTKRFADDMKIGNIEIEDQSGNNINCKVSVYVDISSPEVTLNVYKRSSSGKADGSPVETIFIKKATGDTTKNIQINKNTVNGWLNKTNYPYGVYIEVKYDEVSSVDKIEWSENATNLKLGDSNIYKLVNTTTITPKKTITDEKETGTFHFSITDEGYRYGTLTLTDEVGHKATINITAPIDRTKPVCSKSGESTTWTGSNRTITVNCSDSISGCYSYPGRQTISSTTKVKTYSLIDTAGNTTYCDANVYVDKTAPSCSTTKNESTKWTYSNRTLTQYCSDGESGCKNEYTTKTFSSTVQIGYITITDKVGNSRDCPLNVYIDKTPPTCGSASGSSSTWTNSNRTITQYCNDTGSGCTVGSVTRRYSSNTTTDSVTFYDEVGNSKTCTYNVYVDKISPTCGSASGSSSSWTNGNRTVTQNCSDSGSNQSGCDGTFKRTYSYTTWTDRITISDKAGNTVTCPYFNVYVDKEAPSCDGTSGSSYNWTSSSRTVTQYCYDSTSGCRNSSYNSTYSSGTVDWRGTYIYDNAGNSRYCEYPVYVDKEAPYVPTLYIESASSSTYVDNNSCNGQSFSTGSRSCDYTIHMPKGEFYYISWEAAMRDVNYGSGPDDIEAQYWCDDGKWISQYTEYRSWTSWDNVVRVRSKDGATSCTLLMRTRDNVGNLSPTLTVHEHIQRY